MTQPNTAIQADQYPAEIQNLFQIGYQDTNYKTLLQNNTYSTSDLLQIIHTPEFDDAPEPAYWTPVHALHLLAQLGPTELSEQIQQLILSQRENSPLQEAAKEILLEQKEKALPTFLHILQKGVEFHQQRCELLLEVPKLADAAPSTREPLLQTIQQLLTRTETEQHDLEEDFNADLIHALLILEAPETYPTIRQAFEGDRVYPEFLSQRVVDEHFGLQAPSNNVWHKVSSDWVGDEMHTIHLLLRCTQCTRSRWHAAPRLFFYPDQQQLAPGDSYPILVQKQITCPKCGAVDQYAPSLQVHKRILDEMEFLLQRSKHARNKQQRTEVFNQTLIQISEIQLHGNNIDPWHAIEQFPQEIKRCPDDASLRREYAHLLEDMGQWEKAQEQLAHAYQLQPSIEWGYILGALAFRQEHHEQAIEWWKRTQDLAQTLDRIGQDDRFFLAQADKGLQELNPAPKHQRGPNKVSSLDIPKNIGRNDPCYCGSGRKYKKCCLRS